MSGRPRMSRLTEEHQADLVAEARQLAETMAAAGAAATRRREVLRELHDGGLSLRTIASLVGGSSTAMAQAVRDDR